MRGCACARAAAAAATTARAERSPTGVASCAECKGSDCFPQNRAYGAERSRASQTSGPLTDLILWKTAPSLRLDVWLDVACLFKTRSEAQRACKGGKVDVNGQSAKPHREVKPGDVDRNHAAARAAASASSSRPRRPAHPEGRGAAAVRGHDAAALGRGAGAARPHAPGRARGAGQRPPWPPRTGASGAACGGTRRAAASPAGPGAILWCSGPLNGPIRAGRGPAVRNQSGNSTRFGGESAPPDPQAHRAQPRAAVQAAHRR